MIASDHKWLQVTACYAIDPNWLQLIAIGHDWSLALSKYNAWTNFSSRVEWRDIIISVNKLLQQLQYHTHAEFFKSTCNVILYAWYAHHKIELIASDPIWSQLIPILDGGWLQLIAIDYNWSPFIAIDYDWFQLIVIDRNWLQSIENSMGLPAHDWSTLDLINIQLK